MKFERSIAQHLDEYAGTGSLTSQYVYVVHLFFSSVAGRLDQLSPMNDAGRARAADERRPVL